MLNLFTCCTAPDRLFPFGPAYGDNTLIFDDPDDGYNEITLQQSFLFGYLLYDIIYVSSSCHSEVFKKRRNAITIHMELDARFHPERITGCVMPIVFVRSEPVRLESKQVQIALLNYSRITGSPAGLSRVNGVRCSSAKTWNFNTSPKTQFYINWFEFGVGDTLGRLPDLQNCVRIR